MSWLRRVLRYMCDVKQYQTVPERKGTLEPPVMSVRLLVEVRNSTTSIYVLRSRHRPRPLWCNFLLRLRGVIFLCRHAKPLTVYTVNASNTAISIITIISYLPITTCFLLQLVGMEIASTSAHQSHLIVMMIF